MSKWVKKLIKLLLVVFLIHIAWQFFCSYFPVKHEEFIAQNAMENNLEKNLVYGIINAESGFDSNAVSKKGAVGLMQLKEDTALWSASKMGLKDIDKEDLFNPEINIKIGTWYFSYLKQELGSEELAIVAYNAGITHVKEWLDKGIIDKTVSEPDNIPFEETRKYIKKVKFYKKIYGVINKVKGWGNK